MRNKCVVVYIIIVYDKCLQLHRISAYTHIYVIDRYMYKYVIVYM